MPNKTALGRTTKEGDLFWFDIDLRSIIERSEFYKSDEYEDLYGDYQNANLTTDPLRIKFKIIQEESTAQRNVDFVAPKATLSTVEFNPQDIFTTSRSNGYGRLYIPILEDEIVEDDESVTIRLEPNIIEIPKSCLNCHRIIDIWEFIKPSSRGFNDLNPAKSNSQETTSITKNYAGIFDKIISSIRQIKSGKKIADNLGENTVGLEWSGFLTFDSSTTYSVKNTVDATLLSLGASKFYLGCEKETTTNTTEINIGANKQQPFKYRFELDVDKVRSLDEAQISRLENLANPLQLQWKKNNQEEYTLIDPGKFITWRRHSWSSNESENDYYNLTDAKEKREVGINSFEIVDFKQHISPRRQFEAYSLGSETKATVKIKDNGKFVPSIVATPHKIQSPREIQAYLNNNEHTAKFDLHFTSRPQNTVKLKFQTPYNISNIAKNSKLQKISGGYKYTVNPEDWDQIHTFNIKNLPLDKRYKLSIISSSADHYYDEYKTKVRFIPEGYFEGKPIGDLKPVITLFEDKKPLLVDEPEISLEIEEKDNESVANSYIKIKTIEPTRQDTTIPIRVKYVNTDGNHIEKIDVLFGQGEQEKIVVLDKSHIKSNTRIYVKTSEGKDNDYKSAKDTVTLTQDELPGIRIFEKNTVGESIILSNLKKIESRKNKGDENDLYTAQLMLYGVAQNDFITIPKNSELIFSDELENLTSFRLVDDSVVFYKDYIEESNKEDNDANNETDKFIHPQVKLKLIDDSINPNLIANLKASIDSEIPLLTAPYEYEQASLGDSEKVTIVHDENPKPISKTILVSLSSRPESTVKILLPNVINKDRFGSLKVSPKGDNIDTNKSEKKYLEFQPDSWDTPKEVVLRSSITTSEQAVENLFNFDLVTVSSSPIYDGIRKTVIVDKYIEQEDEPLDSINEKQEPISVQLRSVMTNDFNEGENKRDRLFVLERIGKRKSRNQRSNKDIDVKVSIEQISGSKQSGSASQPYLLAGRGIVGGLRSIQSESKKAENQETDLDGITYDELKLFRSRSDMNKYTQETIFRSNNGYLKIPFDGYYSFRLTPQRAGDFDLLLDGKSIINETVTAHQVGQNLQLITEQLRSDRPEGFEISLEYETNTLSSDNTLEALLFEWKKPGDTDFSEIPNRYYSTLIDGDILRLKGRRPITRFGIGLDDDQLDSNSREYAISIESMGEGGCNVSVPNQDKVIDEYCDQNRDKNNQTKSNYKFAESIIELEFTDISPAISNDDTTSLNIEGDYLTTLKIKIPNYHRGVLKGKSVVIPEKSTLFINSKNSNDLLYFQNFNELTIDLSKRNKEIILTEQEFRASDDLNAILQSKNIKTLEGQYNFPSPIRFTVIDNDHAGYSILNEEGETTSLVPEVAEGADIEESMAVRLNTKPTDTVKITLESENYELLGLVDPFNESELSARLDLVFTPADWNKPKIFSFKANENNFIHDKPRTKVNIFARSTSLDPQYNDIDTSGEIVFDSSSSETISKEFSVSDRPIDSEPLFESSEPGVMEDNIKSLEHKVLSNGPIKVKVVDNDKVGIIATSSNSGKITESGNGYVDFKLTTQPSSDVTLTLTPPTEVNLIFNALQFTNSGDGKYLINTDIFNATETASGDSDISSFEYLVANNQLDFFDSDGNVARFLVSNDIKFKLPKYLDSINVDIPVDFVGSSAALKERDLNLSSEPLSATFSSRPQFRFEHHLLPEPTTVHIKEEEWDQPHRIFINAVSDNLPENLARQPIKVTSSSDDKDYDNTINTSVHVEVVDNDIPEARLVLVNDGTEQGEPAKYRVELSSPAPLNTSSKGIVVDYQLSVDTIDEAIRYGFKNKTPKSIDKLSKDELFGFTVQYPTSTTKKIRIPPGQLYSEEFLVPIDDFVADKIDKTIKIQLSSTDSLAYKVSPTENTIRADIRNNDKAGLLVIHPGDRIRVSEDDRGGAVLVALTSQPNEDVTVNFEEDYGETSPLDKIYPKQLETGGTVTFTPANWFVPQPLLISAIDDNIVEDRINNNHSALVVYENIQSEDDPDINDTVPYRYYYDDSTSTSVKSAVPESHLDNTGYHPAKINFNIETCDEIYQNIPTPVVEIEVVDAEVPVETAERITEQFSLLQNVVGSVDIAGSDNLSREDTHEAFEPVIEFQESLTDLDYQTPAAVNKTLNDSFTDDSTGNANNPSGEEIENEESNKSILTPNYKARNISPGKPNSAEYLNYSHPLGVSYDPEQGNLSISNLYLVSQNKKIMRSRWQFDPTSLTLVLGNSEGNLREYNLTTSESAELVKDKNPLPDPSNPYKRFKVNIKLNASDRIEVQDFAAEADVDDDLDLYIAYYDEKFDQYYNNRKRSYAEFDSSQIFKVIVPASNQGLSDEIYDFSAPPQGGYEDLRRKYDEERLWIGSHEFKRQLAVRRLVSLVGPKANQEEWQLRNQFTAKTGIVFNKEWQTYESSIHFNWLAKHQLHGHNLDVKDIGFSTDLGLQGHWIVQAGINLLTPLKQKTPRVISARSIAPNEALRIPGFSSNPAFSARLSGPSKGDHSVAHLKGLPTLPPLSSVTNLFKKKSAHSYLDTRKSLIKTGYSLEPSGGLTGVIGPPEGGLALRLENYNCQTPQCKEIANDDDGIGTGIAVNGLIGFEDRGNKYKYKYNDPKMGEVERGAKKNIVMLKEAMQHKRADIVTDASLAFKLTTGFSTIHDSPNTSEFPRYAPSVEAGFAYKFPEVSLLPGRDGSLWDKTRRQSGSKNSLPANTVSKPTSQDSGYRAGVQAHLANKPLVSNPGRTTPQSNQQWHDRRKRAQDNLNKRNTNEANKKGKRSIASDWIFYDVKMDLGDMATNVLNPTLKHIDYYLKEIYPTMDVFYGEIAFFNAFDPSVKKLLDTDRNGKVTLTDIVMSAARAAGAAGGKKLCVAAMVLNQLGSYLDQFVTFTKRNVKIAKENDRLDALLSLYDFGFDVRHTPGQLIYYFDKIGKDERIDIHLSLSSLNDKVIANKDIALIPKGTKGSLTLNDGSNSKLDFPIKGFGQLAAHKNENKAINSSDKFVEFYQIRNQRFKDSVAYQSLVGFLTHNLIQADSPELARVSKLLEKDCYQTSSITSASDQIKPNYQAALYLKIANFVNNFKSDILAEDRIDKHKELYDEAFEGGYKSYFKDSLLSEEQFVLHSIVDSLVAELDNSTIPNESTSQVNFKKRHLKNIIPVLKHYLSDGSKRRLKIDSTDFAERFESQNCLSDNSGNGTASDPNFSLPNSSSILKIDDYDRPRMDIQLLKYFDNNSKDSNGNPITRVNSKGERVNTSRSGAAHNSFNVNPNEPVYKKSAKRAGNILGVRNLCDVNTMLQEIESTNFSFDFAKVPELAAQARGDDDWLVKTPSTRNSASSRSVSDSSKFISPLKSTAQLRPLRNSGSRNTSSDPLASLSDLVPFINKMNRWGFYFPLIQNTDTVKKLLLGEPTVDLVTYTVPGLSARATAMARAPIIKPIYKRIGGTIGIDARLGFGFDTSGLTRWANSGASAHDLDYLLDGFYVSDKWSFHEPLGQWFANPNGVDLPELSVDGSLFAGIEGNLGLVRAIVEGGVFANVGIDYIDNGELTGKNDGRLRGDEIRQMTERGSISDVFALEGGVNFYLDAAVQLGIDLGFFQHWQDIWTQELVNIMMFEFSSVDRSEAADSGNEPLDHATVFFDSNLNGYIDEHEPSTTTSNTGTYQFSINLDTFDSNKDGQIGHDEGRLVSYQGQESTTLLPQYVPFIASSGEHINPVTTLIRLIYENNSDSIDTIKDNIEDMLKLSSEAYLQSDPYKKLSYLRSNSLNPREITDAVNDFTAHNLLHATYDLALHIAYKIYPSQFTNELSNKIELMSILSNKIYDTFLKERGSLADTLLTASVGFIQDIRDQFPDTISQESIETFNPFIKLELGNLIGNLDDLTRDFKESIPDLTTDQGQSLVNRFLRKSAKFKSQHFLHTRGLIRTVAEDYRDQLSDNILDTVSDYLSANKFSHTIQLDDSDTYSDNSDSLTRLRLKGSSSSNTMIGGINHDVLIGGPSKDQLNGGPGSDVLRGGAGADRFHMSKGRDRVLDFSIDDGDLVAVTDSNYTIIRGVGNSTHVKSEEGILRLVDISIDDFNSANPIELL